MAKYFLMRLPVVRAEYVTGKMFLMASRSYPFQVLPDHEIQTHPEIINYFNKRTFSHLKRGIIFTAYLCPKGVPRINELALVRHFDLYRQKAVYKYKVWWSNPSAFRRVTQGDEERQCKGYCFCGCPLQHEATSQAHTRRASLMQATLGLRADCIVPLYSQWRGNPSVFIFPVHIPRRYRRQNRFSAVIYKGLIWLGQALCWDHRLFRVWTRGSPCTKSCCSYYKMRPSVHVHVGQCVPMYKESRHALMQALPEDENKEKKNFFWFACLKKSTFHVDLRLSQGL